MKFQAKYANGEEFTLTASDIDQATKKASEWQETVGASLEDLQPLSSSLVRPLALLDRKELEVISLALYKMELSGYSGSVMEKLYYKVEDEIKLRDDKK